MNEKITPENIIGQSVEELRKNKIRVAVVKNNGNVCITTADLKPDRFRVEVEDGIVTKFVKMG